MRKPAVPLRSRKEPILRLHRRLELSSSYSKSNCFVSSFPSRELQVVSQLGTRLLFNHRDAELKRILLAELLVSAGGASGPFVFPAPIYEIEGLPAQSYTELPSSDEKLDGYTLWHIREAEWEDEKTLTDPVKIGERKLWGGATFSENLVQREVRHLHTEPSRSAIETES